jgi:tetratricopeptide (TPR) repeat protein
MPDTIVHGNRRHQRRYVIRALLAAAVVVCWPRLSLASPPWIPDLETWKDIGSVGAVAISLVALIATQRTTRAKTLREQREELKDSIEKLIDFRTEYNTKLTALATEAEREAFGVGLNTRKSIYLESAEYLALQIPHVTSAEWVVLGTEHMYDSNFAKAEALYNRALNAARKSSLVTRVVALRALAGAQMMQGGAGLTRGRQTYQRAAQMMVGQNDPYSAYTAACTYRMWSGSEYSVGNLLEARAKLADAFRAVTPLPDWFNLKQFELRQCVRALVTLAEGFHAGHDLATAQSVLGGAATALEPMGDGFSKELLAQVRARQAWLQFTAGDRVGAERFATLARTVVAALPGTNPVRAALLTELSVFQPTTAG